MEGGIRQEDFVLVGICRYNRLPEVKPSGVTNADTAPEPTNPSHV